MLVVLVVVVVEGSAVVVVDATVVVVVEGSVAVVVVVGAAVVVVGSVDVVEDAVAVVVDPVVDVDSIVVVADWVVVVVEPRAGQEVGAGARRAKNTLPSSREILPPNSAQNRELPISTTTPTAPCDTPPTAYVLAPVADSRSERPSTSRAARTGPVVLRNLKSRRPGCGMPRQPLAGRSNVVGVPPNSRPIVAVAPVTVGSTPDRSGSRRRNPLRRASA